MIFAYFLKLQRKLTQNKKLVKHKKTGFSPKHKDQILNAKFTQTGVGIAKGTYKGKETEFVVQLFGTFMPSFNTRE